jgi:succinyl-CoA synthetase beta subunit
MRLLEYQGKQILEKYDIPVCTGRVAWTVDEAEKAANEIGYPVVIKAQVLAGGRGKAGGVKFGENAIEVREKTNEILGMIIKDEVTECVLITEKNDIAQDMYAGITIDSIAGLPVLIFSCSGGMDIEQVAEKFPEKVLRKYLDPTKKITFSNIMDFLRKSELEKKLLPEVSKIVLKLVNSFFGADATTAEIIP